VYDNLDFLRGVETFLNGIPATSIEGLRIGMEDELGAKNSNQVVIFDDVMDSKPLFLTGNTSTVYASAFLNLEKDDRGNGGKYLILPYDYEGNTPEGYFVAKSTSHTNWLILRGFLVDAKPDAASKMFREGLKIYPLKDAQNPPAMEFINGSGKSFKREPVSFIDPELRGLFSSIGIQKGKEFNPDNRLKVILEDAVKVGNATARAMAFKTREKEALIYEDRHWESGFLGGDYRWLKDEGNGGRFLDARTRFFYMATVNTPAMVWKLIGKGSQYALANYDKDGNYLDGSKNYKLNIPANVPAKKFWSIVVYDPQTRSELQTDQRLPSVNSQRSPMVKNSDGSIDLYFGPESPEGKENNWIQTVPGKGWFTILRLYSPLEPWYDKTWQPGEIELVK